MKEHVAGSRESSNGFLYLLPATCFEKEMNG
jgi:hypothetical protein